jgi:hypothetical protein
MEGSRDVRRRARANTPRYHKQAFALWNVAVNHAEQHRNNMRHRFDQAAAEMRLIAGQLGDFSEMDDPNSSMVSSTPCCSVCMQQVGSKRVFFDTVVWVFRLHCV